MSYEINLNSLVYTPQAVAANDVQALDMGLRRILLMTYFPSGFWSRLITRLLADEQIIEAIKSSYISANDVSSLLKIKLY